MLGLKSKVIITFQPVLTNNFTEFVLGSEGLLLGETVSFYQNSKVSFVHLWLEMDPVYTQVLTIPVEGMACRLVNESVDEESVG